MNKQKFLSALKNELSHLPTCDAEEWLNFYNEMIDDLTDEGLSEEDAIEQIGSAEEIAAQVISDTPFVKIIKEKFKPSRAFKAWEIILLILGSPIWLSLLIAVSAVIFSLYVTVWSVIISLWAVEISFICCSLGGLISGIVFIFGNHPITGIAVIGAGITFAGLSVFLFWVCKGVSKGILTITRKIFLGIKTRFIKKEEA